MHCTNNFPVSYKCVSDKHQSKAWMHSNICVSDSKASCVFVLYGTDEY